MRAESRVLTRLTVANPQEIEALIEKVVETYGRLDQAFNNAGIEGQLVETPDCTMENWSRLLQST
jgi:NAD(P)-dependent dehydrogenase (short-subunit alcohol dehydrogenase family)